MTIYDMQKNITELNNNPLLIDLKIPQMGEGLREVRIVRLLKKVGELIKEDEIIYEMETKKATVEVESPYAGCLIEWLAQEGEVLEVGSALAIIELLEEPINSVQREKLNINPLLMPKKPIPAVKDLLSLSPDKSKLDIRHISPRVRAYCKHHSISDQVTLLIPYSGKVLMVEDVEKFLANQSSSKDNQLPYEEKTFSIQQQSLNFRFKQSSSVVIPATLVSLININNIKPAVQLIVGAEFIEHSFVSEFQLFAYLVTNVLAKYPKFRSAIIDNKKFHEYKHLNLGIAVQTYQDELVTAVISKADQLSFNNFITDLHLQIDETTREPNQATCNIPHVILTYMGSGSIIFGSPVLVSPSVAILALGSTLPKEKQPMCYLSLTFDHRIINGMDANNFLTDLTEKINHHGVK